MLPLTLAFISQHNLLIFDAALMGFQLYVEKGMKAYKYLQGVHHIYI